MNLDKIAEEAFKDEFEKLSKFPFASEENKDAPFYNRAMHPAIPAIVNAALLASAIHQYPEWIGARIPKPLAALPIAIGAAAVPLSLLNFLPSNQKKTDLTEIYNREHGTAYGRNNSHVKEYLREQLNNE